MAVMKILVYPASPLVGVAKPVVKFGSELKKLAEDMLETMDAHDGVGLAAPQVGIRRRFFVLCEPGGEPMCLANPEITEMEGAMYGEEGCLSLPSLYANVPRATRIHVRAQDVDGNPLEFEARDFLARIIQHEYDHLEGKVFPDRLDAVTRGSVLDEWKAMRQQEKPSPSAAR